MNGGPVSFRTNCLSWRLLDTAFLRKPSNLSTSVVRTHALALSDSAGVTGRDNSTPQIQKQFHDWCTNCTTRVLCAAFVDLCAPSVADRDFHTLYDQPFRSQRLVRSRCRNYSLKGNPHQLVLSEVSQPGIEVSVEKLLPKIFGRLGKEKPAKTMQSCLCAAQVRCDVVSFGTISTRLAQESGRN